MLYNESLNMKTILIIEDNQAIRGMLRDLLKLHGYSVQEASDGAIGLNLAVRSEVDLIICDLKMPKIDGLGVLEELRKISKIPVIIYSSVGYDFAKSEAKRLGAMTFINKDDADPQEVLQTVDYILNGKK